MRFSDWSSDVCSSDLGLVADPRQSPSEDNTLVGPAVDGVGIAGARPGGFGKTASVTRSYCAPDDLYCSTNSNKDGLLDRKSVVTGKSVSVRVVLGGRRTITKKKYQKSL